MTLNLDLKPEEQDGARNGFASLKSKFTGIQMRKQRAYAHISLLPISFTN